MKTLSTPRPEQRPTRTGAWDGWRGHLTVVGAYLLVACYVTYRLWQAPNQRLLRNAQDHVFFEWIFAHGARVLFDGQYPFFSDRLNATEGVNLMANTSVLGISLPLAPVTVLFGPGVSFAVFLTLALAGTAAAWYWVLQRYLVRSRTAAVLGGAFCGFAPGIVSQADGHPNIVAQFVVPFIVARVLLLGRPDRHDRWWRDGLILGALVTYQAFLNEEVLFFTALAVFVAVVVAVLQNRALLRERGRDFLRGLGVAGLLAVAVLAYPLWVQFAGPQHYKGLWGTTDSADLAQYVSFGQATLAGHRVAAEVSPRPEEETSFFGWPLVALIVIMVLFWWRNRTVRLLAITGFVFLLLSLGSTVWVAGVETIPAPWGAIEHLPLFNAVVTIRFGLVVTAVVGVLLAVVTDQVLRGRPPAVAQGQPPARVRIAWFVLVAAALVPNLPLHLRPSNEPPIPAFIADGTWRDYLADGQALVSAPLPTPPRPDAMRWAAYQRLDFALAGGYFLAPADGVDGRSATFGSPRRPTSELFAGTAYSGQVPRIGAEQRAQAVQDVAYWRAGVIVVDPRQYHVAALRDLCDQLFGPGQLVGGLWVWDVG